MKQMIVKGVLVFLVTMFCGFTAVTIIRDVKYLPHRAATSAGATDKMILINPDTRIGSEITFSNLATSLATTLLLTIRGDFSCTATGITYTSSTGIFSLTSGYVIPTTTEETNWNTAYTRSGLFAADSTNWNTAYNLSLLFAADTTNWTLAYTRSELFVADTTTWNTVTSKAPLADPTFTGTVILPKFKFGGSEAIQCDSAKWGTSDTLVLYVAGKTGKIAFK